MDLVVDSAEGPKSYRYVSDLAQRHTYFVPNTIAANLPTRENGFSLSKNVEVNVINDLTTQWKNNKSKMGGKVGSSMDMGEVSAMAMGSVSNEPKNPYFLEYKNGDCAFVFEMQLPIGMEFSLKFLFNFSNIAVRDEYLNQNLSLRVSISTDAVVNENDPDRLTGRTYFRGIIELT